MVINMKVKKKSGNLEDFNVEKIKQAISFACENLSVNPLALESLFNQSLFDGITTVSIQENLIHHAKTLCSPQEPDWVFVAGRLETMNLWSRTGSYKVSFPEFVNNQVAAGIWKHPAFTLYSDEELVELGDWLDKERDLDHSYASVVTAQQKYLMKNESVQQMFMGNAMIIASVEKEENRIDICKRAYEYLSLREVSSATPWLGNLRENGNISSCFIIQPDDSLISIYDNLKNAALISQAGGGLGVSLARLRAKGSDLMGVEGIAGGVLGWNKLFNDTAVSVNQRGKRAGAFTIALPIWHADIEDFLDCQTEAGDLRKKSFDIQPQVGIHDIFMRLKDDYGNEWHTFCPHEVESKLGIKIYESYGTRFEDYYARCVEAYKAGILKVCHVHDAKKLFIRIMEVAFETGLPYLAFIDTINEANPNKHEGFIPCVNLCTESFSVVVPDKYFHTCNLMSLVVGRIPTDQLEKAAGFTLRMLDNGIELTNPPLKESGDHNQRYRTVGIGIQGLHDLVAREHGNFLDEKFMTEIAERIQYGAVMESIELARERGPYPAFQGSDWQNGTITRRYKQNSVVPEYDWDYVQSQIDIYGIRNSQLTSPAPNTSSSIFMDAAAGIMPVYSAFFYEDNANGALPVAGMFLAQNPLSYSRDVTKYYPWDLTRTVGALQKFIDTGISAEYIMDKNNPEFNAKFLWKVFDMAWKNGNKAVYYIRTIKQGEQLVKGAEICAGCSG